MSNPPSDQQQPDNQQADTRWAVLSDRGGLFTCEAENADVAIGKWFSSRPMRLPELDDTTYSGRLVRYAWTERVDAGLSTVKRVDRAAIVCTADQVLPSDAPDAGLADTVFA